MVSVEAFSTSRITGVRVTQVAHVKPGMNISPNRANLLIAGFVVISLVIFI